jgi:hypothetical protein
LSDSDDDASTIKVRGWRQGSVLPPSLFETLHDLTGLEFRPEDHCALVANQDCDVVSRSYNAEPSVEIVRAVRKSTVDGNLLYAKSGRKLQIELAHEGGTAPFEMSIHERVSIDRKVLEGSDPDSSKLLSEEQKRLFAGWLGRRYTRHPFPDCFVERLKQKPYSENLRDLFKTWGDHISGVFLLLNRDDDLPPEESYVVTGWATVPTDIFNDEEIRSKLEEEFQPLLESILGAFQGIDLQDAMVVSEEDFTLDDLRRTKRLDLDNLSYRDDTPIAKVD